MVMEKMVKNHTNARLNKMVSRDERKAGEVIEVTVKKIQKIKL